MAREGADEFSSEDDVMAKEEMAGRSNGDGRAAAGDDAGCS